MKIISEPAERRARVAKLLKSKGYSVMWSTMVDDETDERLKVYWEEFNYNRSELLRQIISDWLLLKENPWTTFIDKDSKTTVTVEQAKKDKELDEGYIKELKKEIDKLNKDNARLKEKNDVLTVQVWTVEKDNIIIRTEKSKLEQEIRTLNDKEKKFKSDIELWLEVIRKFIS